MREPVGREPPLGDDRVQHALTKVAHLAKVTGGRDDKTFFPWLFCVILCQSFRVLLSTPFACF